MKTKESEIKKIENEYRSHIGNYENAIRAWSNVKRISKKDGSDFSNFGKNFANATIKQDYKWEKPSLRIDYQCDYGYTYDTLEINENDTVNDMFVKINNRIRLFEGYITEEKKKANNTQYVFNEVDKTITQLMEFCKNEGFRSYEICKFIHENYY